MNKNFSKEHVEMLNKRQREKIHHPYTCDGHNIYECLRESAYNDRNNGLKIAYSDDNEGVLIATERGFICPCGKYKQDWS